MCRILPFSMFIMLRTTKALKLLLEDCPSFVSKKFWTNFGNLGTAEKYEICEVYVGFLLRSSSSHFFHFSYIELEFNTNVSNSQCL